MKKVMILFVLLLIVAGGAIGALDFLKLGPFQEKQLTAEELDAIAEAKELAGESTTSAISITPFSIPLFQGEQIAGNIQVQFELEVTKGKEEEVNSKIIRLEDAYLRDLYVFLPRLLRNKEKLDVIALKRRIMQITEKIIGPGIVEDVLIQSVADNKS
jgi:hypothetical protein